MIFIVLKKNNYFDPLRRDIVDRNGVLLSSNLILHHAAIRSNLVKNKEKFLIKLKILFPNTDVKKLKRIYKLKNNFILKKNFIGRKK